MKKFTIYVIKTLLYLLFFIGIILFIIAAIIKLF